MSYQLVRYKVGKKVFEVATKPGTVRKYRDGKLGWDHVLFSDAVFTNFKKGNIAKISELQSSLGTKNEIEAARIIVEKGESQVSAEERKEDMEIHHRALINFLHRTYTDEKGLPHPVTRLENAIRESKVRLDPSKQVRNQAEEIVKKMQGVLVFIKSSIEYTVFVVQSYARKCTGVIHKAEIQSEQWDAQGCKWVINISPADFDGFCAELGKITGGDYLMAPGKSDPRENRPVEEKMCKKKNSKGKRRNK